MEVYHINVPELGEEREGFTFSYEVASNVCRALRAGGIHYKIERLSLLEAIRNYPLRFGVLYEAQPGEERQEFYYSFDRALKRQFDLLEQGLDPLLEPFHQRAVRVNQVLDLH